MVASVLTVADDLTPFPDQATLSQEGSVSDAAASLPSQTVLPGDVPDGLTASEWSDIQAQIAAIDTVGASTTTAVPSPLIGVGAAGEAATVGVAAPAHQFAFPASARLSSAGVDALVSSAGLSLARPGAESVGLTTSQIGSLAAAAPVVSSATDLVELNHGSVIEWFRATSGGIEHGYTITEPVHAGDELVVRVRVSAGIPTLAGDDVVITRADGSLVGYSGLYAFDADGTDLPAVMGIDAGAITLTVDTAGAVYPITIDPIITEDNVITLAPNASGDQSGAAVAIDVDALVIASPFDDDDGDDFGKVEAYDYTVGSGAITFRQAWYPASGDEEYGASVDIEGDIFVVGAPGDDGNGTDAGAVYVYTRTGPAQPWAGSGVLLACSTPGCNHALAGGGAAGDRFGDSVSLSDDGSKLVVGAPGANSGDGAVYVIDVGGGYTLDELLTGSNLNVGGFGASVDISADGVLIGVGAPLTDYSGVTDSGVAYVFTDTAGTYVETLEINPQTYGTQPNGLFGTSVAIENTVPTYLVATEPGGGTYFVHDIADIVNTGQDTGNVLQFGGFDTRVSAEGDFVVVGKPLDNDGDGAITILERTGAFTFSETTPTLTGVDGGSAAGTSVSIGSTGSVAFGLPRYDNASVGTPTGPNQIDRGQTRVWDDVSLVSPNETSTLSFMSAARDEFGYTVDLDGDRLAVSAPYADEPLRNSGAVYVFERPGPGSAWSFVALIRSPSPEVDGFFGESLDLFGDQLAVGEPDALGDEAEPGRVWAFERQGGGAWTQLGTEITPSGGGLVGNEFGYSVGFIDVDVLVIGSPGRNADAGGVWATAYNAGWDLPVQLTTGTPDPGDRIGHSVAGGSGLSATLAVAGAPGDDTQPTDDAGAIYIWEDIGSGFGGGTAFQKIDQTGGGWLDGDGVGSAVNTDGLRIVAAGLGDFTAGQAFTGHAFEVVTPGSPNTWGHVWDFRGTVPVTLSAPVNDYVDVDGGTIALGRPGNGGQVGIFRYDGTTWPEAPDDQFIPVGTANGDRVGSTVAIEGRTLVTGASGDDRPSSTDEGSVFEINDLVLAQLHTGGDLALSSSWFSGVVPGPDDTVVIPGSAGTVNVGGTVDVGRLLLGAGTTLRIVEADTLSIGGNSSGPSEIAGTLENLATSTLNIGADLVIPAGGTITTFDGMVTNIDASAASISITGDGTFDLQGTLNKNGAFAAGFASTLTYTTAATAVTNINDGDLAIDPVVTENGDVTVVGGSDLAYGDSAQLTSGATLTLEPGASVTVSNIAPFSADAGSEIEIGINGAPAAGTFGFFTGGGIPGLDISATTLRTNLVGYSPTVSDVYTIASCYECGLAPTSLDIDPFEVSVIGSTGSQSIQLTVPPIIVVDTLADNTTVDGLCTLREAILAANTDSTTGDCLSGNGVDTIEFGLFGTINLTSPLPAVTDDLTIDGGTIVTIDGGGSHSITSISAATSVTLDGLVITDANTQSCPGTTCGAIVTSGDLTVIDSEFVDNTMSSNANGSAITNDGGTLTVEGSTFSGNTSSWAGPIWNRSGTTNVSNSTFAGNTAQHAAIYNFSGATLNVWNSTFVGNNATSAVINTAGGGASTTIRNSIIANTGEINCQVAGGSTLTVDAFNLAVDGTCGSATTVTAADLDLGTLADNGGPTDTVAIGVASVALGAGDPAVCGAAPVGGLDQRGVARAVTACDVGAFEVPTHVVNNTGDAGDFDTGDLVCETGAGNGVCTLRAAIEQANAAAGFDRVHFDIPGGGVQTIAPASQLPTITDIVTIDGLTQPGADCSTWPPTLNVELNLSNSTQNALNLASGSSGSTLSGLVLNRATTFAVVFSSPGHTVTCNFIGTDPAGNALSGTFRGFWTQFAGAGSNTITGNLIASTNLNEAMLLGSDDNIVQGNRIQVTPAGLPVTPCCFGSGVALSGSDNLIGGRGPGEGNLIGQYAGDAVDVFFTGATGNTIVGNTIVRASGSFPDAIGIELGSNGTAEGVTANDLGDADTGSNNLQNYPVIGSALAGGSSTRIIATLNSNNSRTYDIDVYGAAACHPSGHGEGETYLGTFQVTTNSIGNAGFDETLPVNVAGGSIITLTATDTVTGDTSEFSACATTVVPGPLVGHWTFDEASSGTGTSVALDSGPFGYDALINGSAVYEPGVIGTGALTFDGVDDYVLVGLFSDLELVGTDYTISFWVNYQQGLGRIITMDDGANNSGGYSIFTSNDCCRITHNTGTANDSGSTYQSLPPGQWHHVAMVYDSLSSEITPYYNGVAQPAFGVDGDLTSDGDDQLLFGAIDNNGPIIQFFEGSLDDIRLYETALSASEVIDLSCTTSWTGAVDGNWATAGNWTDGVPDAADIVCIDGGTGTITIPAGTFEVDELRSVQDDLVIDGDLTVNNLSFVDSSITVNGSLDAVGDVVINGDLGVGLTGVVSGLVTIANGATATLDGGTLDGGNFINNGDVTVTATPLLLDNGVAVDNNGTWTFDFSGALTMSSGTGGATFDNAAVIEQVGTGTTLISPGNGLSMDMGPGSAITVTAGTLDVQTPGTWTGTPVAIDLNVDDGAALDVGLNQTMSGAINGTSSTLSPGKVTFTGVKTSSSTLSLDFPADPAAPTSAADYMLDMQSIVFAGDPVTLVGAGRIITGAQINNAGFSVAPSGTLVTDADFTNTAPLTNFGTWVGRGQGFGSGATTFTNNGTFVADRGGSFQSINPTWVSSTSSTIDLQPGSLTDFQSGHTELGTVIARAGSRTAFSNIQTFGPGSTLEIEVTGPSPSPANFGETEYDNPPILDPTAVLRVSGGYAPTAGDSYPVIECFGVPCPLFTTTDLGAYAQSQVGNNVNLVQAPVVPGKINALDADGTFGASVDTDGDLLVIGAPDVSEGDGAAYIFRHDGLDWQLEGSIAGAGADSAQFGAAVAVDNGTVFVGAPNSSQSGNAAGAVFVFQDSGGGTWAQTDFVTQAALDNDSDDLFGAALDVTNSILFVGAPGDDAAAANAGAVYRFAGTGDNSNWGSVVLKSTASDATANDQFGTSVALRGRTAVVGAPLAGATGDGQAYVFWQAGNSWTQRDILVASDADSGDDFGRAVATSGNTIVVGAPDNTLGTVSGAGAAYVFTGEDNDWVERSVLTASVPELAGRFGIAVDTIGDLALVGSQGAAASTGAAFMFERSSANTWSLLAVDGEITAPDGSGGDTFGTTVALSADHQVIGAPGDAGGDGSAYTGIPAHPVVTERLLAPGVDDFDRFGYAVDIDGTTAVVGMPDVTGGLPRGQGRAYVFTYDGANWILQQELVDPDPTTFDAGYGYDVTVDGDTVAVGSWADEVWIWTRDAGLWSSQQKIDGGATSDNFGAAVDLDDGTLVIGAFQADTAGANAGAAFVWTGSGDNWTLQQALPGSLVGAGDRFGESVGVDGDRIVVGSPRESAVAGNAGAAYIYERSGSIWSESFVIPGEGAAAGDFFGGAVSISGDLAVVGALGQNTPGSNNAGWVHLYDVGGVTPTLVDSEAFPDVLAGGAEFGGAVHIDGNRVVVGAEREAGRAGRAYAYGLSGDDLVLLDTFEASDTLDVDTEYGDRFGQAVTISGELVLVGASEDDTELGGDSGSAYAFTASAVPAPNRIESPAPEAAQAFGFDIDIDGDKAVVGKNDPDSAGGVWVFAYNPGSGEWEFEDTLVAPGGTSPFVRYGQSVAIVGDIAGVIGGDTVTIFADDGAGNWSEIDTVVPSSSTEGLQQIEATLYNGTPRLAVSTQLDDDLFFDNGAMWVLEGTTTPGSWSEIFAVREDLAAGNESNSFYGVALAAEGDLVVVGAPRTPTPGQSGTLWIYRDSGSGYVLEERVFSPTANERLGGALAIEDGRIFSFIQTSPSSPVIGDPAVAVYEFGGSAWSRTATLSHAGLGQQNPWIADVDVFNNVVVLGLQRDDTVADDAGIAVTFVRDNLDPDWSLAVDGPILNASDGAVGDEFGRVAISLNGILVGAPGVDTDTGADAGAIYTYDSGADAPAAAEPANKIISPEPESGEDFAFSVDHEGDVLIVGASGNDDEAGDAGTAYAFIRQPDGSWQFDTELQPGGFTGGEGYGLEVAVARAGDTEVYVAAVSAPLEGDGVVYLWELDGSWSGIGTLTGDAGELAFGNALDIHNIGGTDFNVAIGAPDDGFAADDGPGAVYVWNIDLTVPTLTQLAKIGAADVSIETVEVGGTHAGFGSDVAIDEDTILASAPFNDDSGVDAGAVSVLRATNPGFTAWSEEAVLSTCGVDAGGCSPAADDLFGFGLDLDGDTAAIGATGSDTGGRVFVFDRDGTTWSATQDFAPADVASGDSFGISVDIENDVILAGAFAGGASDEGESIVFRNVAGTWSEETTFTGADTQSGDQVGISSSLSTDGSIILGSRNTTAAGIPTAGAAYAFEVLIGDNPQLTFGLARDGLPTPIVVAPTGIAIADFTASILEENAENETTIAASPLSEINLEGTPLSTIALGQTPLSTIVLESVPLSTIPLLNIDVDGGWDQILKGTVFEDVPINDITFGEVLSDTSPPAGYVDTASKVQALPLSTIDVQGTPLSTIPLSTIALGTIPLSTIPLSTIGLDWCDIIEGFAVPAPCTAADLANVTLMEATLAGTPLSTIPLSTIPLSTIPVENTPLSTIPLSTIDFQATPLSTIPLSTIPLSTIEVGGTPLSTIPLSTIDLNGTPLSTIPLSTIPLSTIDVQGTELSDIPLSTIGVGGTPLSTIPVSIPLSTIPLSTIGVESTPLSTIPLSTIVLADAPLSTIPLSTIGGSTDWCDVLAEGGHGVTCDAGVDVNSTTLAELSVRGVPLSTIPLSTIPLSTINLAGTPLSTIPLSTIPLSTISLEALPLSTIDLQGTPLSTIDPNATPLSTIPLSTIPLSTIDIAGSPLSTIPLSTIPLSTIGLDTVPLSTIPLSTIPLSTIDLGAIDLAGTPLSTIPLSTIDILGSPLSTIPLSTIPLSTIGVNCGLVNCQIDSLGDAIRVGAVPAAATLEQLQTALAGFRLADIADNLTTHTLEQVVAGLEGSGETLGDLTGLDDVTLGELPRFLAELGAITLADLEGVLFELSLGDLIGALIDPATGAPFSDTDTQAALEQAVADLGLTIGQVDALGDATLGELLDGGPDLFLGDLGSILGFVSVESVLTFLNATTTVPGTTLGDLAPEQLGNLVLGSLFGGQVPNSLDAGFLGELLQELEAEGALEGFTLGDLLLALVGGGGNLPFGGFDFTEVEVADLPTDTVPAVAFDANFSLEGNLARSVEVSVEVPATASYIQGASATIEGTTTPLEPDVDGNRLTWTFTNVNPGDSYEIDFDVLPTISLGSTSLDATARIVGTDISVPASASVAVQEGIEPNDYDLGPLGREVTEFVADTLYLTYIADPTDIDVFEVQVAENDVLAIELSNLTADLDIALYANPSDTLVGSALSDESGNDPVIPITDPDQTGADAEPLDDFVRLDEIDGNLQLLEVSNTSGLDNEVIVTDRLPAGTYYVQVYGANGATTVEPAALQIQLQAAEVRPTCQPLGVQSGGSPGTSTTISATANALFLVNEQRIEQLYGPQARIDILAELAELETFLTNNPGLGIDPAIVSVEAFPGVAPAYDTWDSDATCNPETANEVVAAINSAILTPQVRAQLDHIVIVGGDELIPMARLEDATAAANEYDYRHEFDDDAISGADTVNAFSSLFWERRFLSDEPYGEQAAQSLGNRFLYISDVALGRLVETPDQIVRALDDFVATGGSLDTDNAAVLGYDFLIDGSQAIADDLNASSITTVEDSLVDGDIDPDTDEANNTDPNDRWDQLIATTTLTTAGQNSLISLNAHFDHYRALPAIGDQEPGFDDNLIAAEFGVAAGPTGLAQSLVYSMGCHSGLAVPDVLIGDTNEDWAQEFAGTGALYVGNTGFGYGDTEAVAYTEQVMALFTEYLVNPIQVNGVPTTVGQALTYAKNQYVADLAVLSVYDEKAVMESTFYGLPFYRTALPTVPAPPVPDNTTAPDSTGTPSVPVSIDAENEESATTERGTYYFNLDDSGDEQTIVAPGRPIQPSKAADVSVVDPADTTRLDEIAHGAILLERDSTWVPLPDPVVATPIFNEGDEQPEPELGDVTFPATPVTINRYVTPGGERQNIVVATGQYRSNEPINQQRLDTNIDVAVYYAEPSETDFDEPTIGAVTSTLVNGRLTVNLTATDTNPAGVDRVYLLIAPNPGSGTNVPSIGLDLAPGTGDQWSGSVQLPAGTTDVRFLVQAKDAVGNVGYATNKALDFGDDGSVPPPPPPTPDLVLDVSTVGLDPVTGWYDAPVEITVDTDGAPASFSIDGSAPLPVPPSGVVTIPGDGIRNWTITLDDDPDQTQSGTVQVDAAATPPTIDIGTPVAAGSYVIGTADFDVICADTSLQLCELKLTDAATVDTFYANGDPLPTLAGDYMLTVTATDGAGLSTVVGPITFTITAPIDEVPEIELVQAPTEPTLITDGVDVSVFFDDADGAADDYTVTIDFGDYDENETPGSSTVCTAVSGGGAVTSDASTCELVLEPDGAGFLGRFDADLVYAEPGVYTLTATVTDSVGNTDPDGPTVFEFVVVYDPEAGRVNGAGWFWSSNDSYPLDNDPFGNWAFFGFNARYRNNQATPRGSTRLHLLREFYFRSTGYDYLIINDTTAVAEGTGRLDGQSGYRFRIQGIDNGWLDFVQITIWDEDTDEVVYDNGVMFDEGDVVLFGGIRIRS